MQAFLTSFVGPCKTASLATGDQSPLKLNAEDVAALAGKGVYAGEEVQGH